MRASIKLFRIHKSSKCGGLAYPYKLGVIIIAVAIFSGCGGGGSSGGSGTPVSNWAQPKIFIDTVNAFETPQKVAQDPIFALQYTMMKQRYKKIKFRQGCIPADETGNVYDEAGNIIGSYHFVINTDCSGRLDITYNDGTYSYLQWSAPTYVSPTKLSFSVKYRSKGATTGELTVVWDNKGTAADFSDDIVSISGKITAPEGGIINIINWQINCADGSQTLDLRYPVDGTHLYLNISAPDPTTSDITISGYREKSGEPRVTFTILLHSDGSSEHQLQADKYLCTLHFNADCSGYGQVKDTTSGEIVATVVWDSTCQGTITYPDNSQESFEVNCPV